MKWPWAPVGLFLLLGPEAFAHGGDGPIAPKDLWHHWSFDPWVIAPLLLAHWLYGRGILRAWRRAGVGRIVSRWRAACFLAGELVLVVALVSPLDPMGETLLTAHMAQHILLMAVAPPLLVLGLPVRAWMWALPRDWRRLSATPAIRALNGFMMAPSRPLGATLLASAVMWAWHAPALFEAALIHPWVHTLEHVSFFATSLLFWRAALARDTPPVVSAASVLVTFMIGGMLGGLLVLAPFPLYDWYGDHARLWGMTTLEDQQLAGISMWVLAAGIYLAAFAGFAFRSVGVLAPQRSRPRAEPRIGIMRARTSSRSMK